VQGLINDLKQTWKNLDPVYPFDFEFLDAKIQKHYAPAMLDEALDVKRTKKINSDSHREKMLPRACQHTSSPLGRASAQLYII
jgi:hypothetical protein